MSVALKQYKTVTNMLCVHTATYIQFTVESNRKGTENIA